LAGSQPAAVQSVKVTSSGDSATVKILSTLPLTPQLQTIESPPRLVIDLPNSVLSTARRRIAFRNAQIKDVRMNQYQAQPAVTRIVVDLAAPVRYSWDGVGRRLNIHIRADEAATAKPATVPAVTPGTQPIAVPYAEGSSGALVEAGSRVASGSSITARDEVAVLRLTRGGEVRVCPGTTLSVATSPTGQDLLLGMNTGAIETHYHLEESSDSVLTPDFRIVLPGPGEFNLAIRSDPRGDTCVSSLAGSNASVVVAELLGNGTYEVKPEQQVLFRQGRMQSVETPLTPCGCARPPEPVMRAADPAAVVQEGKMPSKLALADPNDRPAPAANVNGSAGHSAAAAPIPEARTSGESGSAQVSTGLVFNAKEVARQKAESLAQMTAQVAAVPLPQTTDPLPPVLVLPPATPKPQRKGFFARLGHAFRSIF
jgi:hypothetical protein